MTLFLFWIFIIIMAMSGTTKMAICFMEDLFLSKNEKIVEFTKGAILLTASYLIFIILFLS